MIKKRNSLLIKKVKELNDNGYIILKNVIPEKLLNETKKFASEFLKCRSNSKDIIASMGLLETRDKKKFYNFCFRLGDVLPVVKTAYLKKKSNIVEKLFKNKNIYLTDNCVFYNKAEVKRLYCNLELADCVLFNSRIAHKTGSNTLGYTKVNHYSAVY